MTAQMNHLGTINDLTISAEFLMEAVRQIAAGATPEDPKVQDYIKWAVCKSDCIIVKKAKVA